MSTAMTDPAAAFILPAVVCFLVSMLMVGALAALFRLHGLYSNGLLEMSSIGDTLEKHLSEPRYFVFTTGTINLAATAFGSVAVMNCIRAYLPGASDAGAYILLVLLVVVVWLAGGVAAKRLATGSALDFMRVLTRVLTPVYWIFRPWSALFLAASGKADDTSWGVEVAPHLSTDEIRSLLQEDDSGVNLEDGEMEMIHSIFSFHGMAVREIMIPRIDIVTLDADMPVSEALKTVVECRHSRIPVHAGSVDKINGLLYAKDLLALVEDGSFATSSKTVGELIRPAYFIPESKKLDEVLSEFRTQHIHMAVVIDEYGGTAGIVTMEDVLEEIVGEIEDEFDEAEQLHTWIDGRTLRVDPKIDLEDLRDLLGVEIPLEEGSETLAGLVYEAAGKVPESGDEVQVADLHVRVEKVIDQRILRVLITAEADFPAYPAPDRDGGA